MWPFDTIHLVLSSTWVFGSLVPVLGALLYCVGLILQKKAAYQIMGSKIESEDPPPAWNQLFRRKLFWVGMILFLLSDSLKDAPLIYARRPHGPGIHALTIPTVITLIVNFFVSYALLYEHFERKDLVAMAICCVSSIVMDAAFLQSDSDHFAEYPVWAIESFSNDGLVNFGFRFYAGVWLVACVACFYISCLLAVAKPFALAMLAALPYAAFRLLAKLLTALLELKDPDLQANTLLFFVAVLAAFFFGLYACASCEGVRNLPCRFFLPAVAICSEVLVEAQDLLFFRHWQAMSSTSFYVFVVASAVAMISVFFVSATSGTTLPSPRRDSLLADPVRYHRTVTCIMDEYNMRIKEAKNPAELQLIDMQPDKFQGKWQQMPALLFVSVVAVPAILFATGWTYTTFTLCTVFSVIQGWKMGAFVPIFAYVGVIKMQRYKNAEFKELYEREDQDNATNRYGRPAWKDVVHFVIVPNYKETLEDLRMTINSVAASESATKQIGLILAMEKGEEGSREKAAGLIEEFRAKFRYTLATYHPKVLQNGEHPEREVAGKSANAQWAARRLFGALKSERQVPSGVGTYSEFGCFCYGVGSAAAPKHVESLSAEAKQRRQEKAEEIRVETLQQEGDIVKALSGQAVKLDACIITVGDADSEFHKKYFEALTYCFLHGGGEENETPLRYLTMWQPPILHMKNFLSQPWPVRLASMATSAHELANLADPHSSRVAYSTYSLSAKLAEAMDGWDPEWMTEDWHTTLKVFLTTGGRLRVMPIFFPILNNTPEGDTVKEALWARWEQGKRHALGISELVFFHEHALRVLFSAPGWQAKLVFVRRAWFLWFKLVWIHAFIALFPIFSPLNGLLIAYFDRNLIAQQKSINSWAFLTNCVFQSLGVVAAVFLFGMTVLIFEAVKERIDGVCAGGRMIPELSLRWRSPFMHLISFAFQSTVSLPCIIVVFAWCEWRAAFKTALTKGGGFVYVSAAVGAQQAKGGKNACTIL